MDDAGKYLLLGLFKKRWFTIFVTAFIFTLALNEHAVVWIVALDMALVIQNVISLTIHGMKLKAERDEQRLRPYRWKCPECQASVASPDPIVTAYHSTHHECGRLLT